MRLSSLAIAAFGIVLQTSAWSTQSQAASGALPESADVIVIGATPAGIAAAIAAAQGGAEVLLIEETRHVGGIISAGLTRADVGKEAAVGGAFNEFRRRIVAFYTDQYGKDSRQVQDCKNGTLSEPHVAERVFRDMLAEHPRVRLLAEHYLEQAKVKDNRLEAMVIRSVHGGKTHTVRGTVFIDATYEGDLAAAAGVPYSVGRESRATYGESLAGRIYTRIDGTRTLLPGSTGEGDAGIQAYCFRLCLTTDPAKRAPVVQPAGYRREDYRHLLADLKAGRITQTKQIMQISRIPNEKFEINSNHLMPSVGGPSESFDLAEENWGWPEASREERRRIFARYWSYQEGLLWFLQTDPEVPEALRREASSFGFCGDEFVDNNHRPHLLYVREARRIQGEYTLTQREEEVDPATGVPRLHPDSIAIASYAWDSHAVHKYDPAYPDAREGYFVVSHPPVQVPFGVIVPKIIERLLVPVACSTSHVAYSALRMEPVFMALGQASGIAAVKALKAGIPVRRVPVGEIQAELTKQKGVIAYFPDMTPEHPAFTAIQFLGPRGLSPDFSATPDRVLAQADAADRLARILKASGKTWSAPAPAPTLLSAATLANWLMTAGFAPPDMLRNDTVANKNLTVGDFALAVAEALMASPTKRLSVARTVRERCT